MGKSKVAGSARMFLKKQIEESELETKRGKVIGIGRVKIPKTSYFNYEIPLLSFVVTKKADGSFVSSCIHLQMDGYGQTDKEARIDMVDNIMYYLYENFGNKAYKDSCWLNILHLFKSNEVSSVLWDKYHAVQLMLAERGVTTDSYSQLQRKIKVLENKVKELEKKVKEVRSRERSKFMMMGIPGDKMIIKYETAVA
jgi:hypothetical protein